LVFVVIFVEMLSRDGSTVRLDYRYTRSESGKCSPMHKDVSISRTPLSLALAMLLVARN